MNKEIQQKYIVVALILLIFAIPLSFALSQDNIADVEVYYYADSDLSIPLNTYSDNKAIRTKGNIYLKFVTPANFNLESFSAEGQEVSYIENATVNLIATEGDIKIYKGQWGFDTGEELFDQAIVSLNSDGSTFLPNIGKDIYIDTKPPKLKSIEVIHNQKIELFFDDFWMDGRSVNEASYYSITHELTKPQLIIEDILAGGYFARIFTSSQVSNLSYTITIDNSGVIRDAAGNLFTNVNNSLLFKGNSVVIEEPHGYYSKNTYLCAVCHSTHRSQGQAILALDQITGCFLCHDSAGQSKYDVKSEFGQNPVSKHPLSITNTGKEEFTASERVLCSDCHDVHITRKQVDEKLLRSFKYNNGQKIAQLNTNDYCWSCHGNLSTRNLKINEMFPAIRDFESNYSFGHKELYLNSSANPVNSYKNDCLYCHKGHSSIYSKLLRNRFSVPPISDYDWQNFSLCFDCHNQLNETRFTDKISDLKKYYDGSEGVGHVIRSTNLGFKDEQGNQLPVGWKIPCTDCHDLHGNSFQNEKMLSDDLSKRMGDVIGLWTTEDKRRATCFACHKPSDENGLSGRSYRQGNIPKLDNISVSEYTYQHANYENKPPNPINCLSSNCHGQGGATAHNPVKKPQ